MRMMRGVVVLMQGDEKTAALSSMKFNFREECYAYEQQQGKHEAGLRMMRCVRAWQGDERAECMAKMVYSFRLYQKEVADVDGAIH